MRVLIQKYTTDHNGQPLPVSKDCQYRNRFHAVLIEHDSGQREYKGDADKRIDALVLAAMVARRNNIEMINEVIA